MSMLISTAPPPAQRFFLADSSGSSSRKRFLSLQNHLRSPTVTPLSSSFTTFNPLRLSIKSNEMMMKVKRKESGRGFGAVCYSGSLTNPSIRWISTLSSAVLMLAKGTAVQKSFLVPLFALQAPPAVISWIKGEYGIWTAFLAILFRLFFFIPGELELPFLALLLVIVAPYQVMNIGGRQEGAIVGLAIAAYLAFQHFSRIGNLQKAFEQGSIVATLAVVCVVVISCLLLI
ncbi:COLD-REGULATED 413 INNER MEMBRANE PROTEIN 1 CHLOROPLASTIC-RELATED [Salix koriyanagi]|uniref:COLD-REGULATED 413 INNER MEMBRANE PROTEIN 1 CHLOROPLASTIC-RELATED n=1 Tax=Salix koriyanagi TaxID=2511006 RepID=A0A9Q0WYH6_9ROSI|nr:COLD-REGULATED 413 INNER MEMBRANE PROTEIN 1 CHLOROPLASTIC-RELATED [Salix koriyanagi]